LQLKPFASVNDARSPEEPIGGQFKFAPADAGIAIASGLSAVCLFDYVPLSLLRESVPYRCGFEQVVANKWNGPNFFNRCSRARLCRRCRVRYNLVAPGRVDRLQYLLVLIFRRIEQVTSPTAGGVSILKSQSQNLQGVFLANAANASPSH
jgi:hypothetical protein